MEQFNLDFRKLVQILLYLLGPPLSLLQTRATREYTLCKIRSNLNFWWDPLEILTKNVAQKGGQFVVIATPKKPSAV